MKAITLPEPGGPDALVLDDVPDPLPRPGEVVVEVAAAGVNRADVARWSDAAGWEKVLNRAGTTFRKLPEPDRHDLTRDKAIALMVANPSMIKRPILATGDALEIGFRPERYAALFHR